MKSPHLCVSLSMVAAIVGVTAFGCGDDDDPYDRPDEARDIVSDQQLERMEEGGLTIHGGDSPPSVEGTYLFEDAVVEFTDSERWPDFDEWCHLERTYEPTDNAGEYEESSTSPNCDLESEGQATFVSGTDDCFTLYNQSATQFEDCESEGVGVMSACLADNGDFENPLRATLTLETEGACSAVDEGRTLGEDELGITGQEDGRAEKVD